MMFLSAGTFLLWGAFIAGYWISSHGQWANSWTGMGIMLAAISNISLVLHVAGVLHWLVVGVSLVTAVFFICLLVGAQRSK